MRGCGHRRNIHRKRAARPRRRSAFRRTGCRSTSPSWAAPSAARPSRISSPRQRFSQREAGRPVRVQWTREDDIHHDYYNAVNTQLLTAGLDERGKAHRLAAADRVSAHLLHLCTDQPAQRRRLAAGRHPTARWRSPTCAPRPAGQTCTCASAGCARCTTSSTPSRSTRSSTRSPMRAGADPRECSSRILGPDRIVTLAELGVDKLSELRRLAAEATRSTPGVGRRVIEARDGNVALGPSGRADGRVLGLAAHRSFLTYVAVVVSVVPKDDGRSRSMRPGWRPMPASWSTASGHARRWKARSSSA